MDWIKERAERIKAEQEKENKKPDSVKKNRNPAKKTPNSEKKTPDPVKAKRAAHAGTNPNSYADSLPSVQRMALQLEPQVMGIREILHGLDRDMKIAIKRNFVERAKFRTHCLDFIGSNLTYQDRVFQFFVVCLADIAEWDEFFKFVDIAIHLKQTPEPSWIEKNFEQFRAWSFYDWAVDEQQAKRDPDADGFVTRILEQPDRLPDDVLKVLMSMKFKSLLAAGKDKEALDYGQDALEKGAAIKTAWKKLDRKLQVEE